jgi:2,3-bisphosphoglycerate-independent phosphoglycerate mutase
MPADSPPRPRPVVLCILDGWGERAERADNAIALASTPNWDRFMATQPTASLDASAEHVGLPEGQMGNSEVGHMNIGAGRVVDQDLPRIDKAIADGRLAGNPLLLDLIGKLRASRGSCHLLGLLSPGGVHSHQDQMAALAGVVGGAGVPVRVHAFLDGRDTPPRSALAHLERFLAAVANAGDVGVATVGGRYYGMDRDRRWQRTERAYMALVDAESERAADAPAAVRGSYDKGASDEFVAPTVVGAYAGMRDGDALLMANFRADRARQILGALVDPEFDGFRRRRVVDFAARVGMVAYSERLSRLMGALFAPQNLDNILGQVVADAGLAQLRIAETEKYAHVTFFLNGGREELFPGEERILVPSPKVATYDLKPEMSAPEVADKLVAAIRSGRFDLVVVNFANGDMVGHTGVLAAAIKAAETVDACLGRVEAAVREAGGVLVITADHGNLEQMTDAASGQAHTAHTTNRVPFVVVNPPPGVTALADGRLSDVAPTLLDLLRLPRPAEMSGRSLIARARAADRIATR